MEEEHELEEIIRLFEMMMSDSGHRDLEVLRIFAVGVRTEVQNIASEEIRHRINSQLRELEEHTKELKEIRNRPRIRT